MDMKDQIHSSEIGGQIKFTLRAGGEDIPG